MKDVLVALDKENKGLLEQLKDFIETSDFIANKYAKKNANVNPPKQTSNNSSSGSSCGRSRSSSSCGSSTRWHSGC